MKTKEVRLLIETNNNIDWELAIKLAVEDKETMSSVNRIIKKYGRSIITDSYTGITSYYSRYCCC